MNIHPTAVVESGAELGAGTSVGPGAFIEAGAKIGADCVIGPHVVIFKYVTLGPRCRVHANAVLGDLPQDLAFKNSDESFVRIGADCVIREGVTIHRGTKPGTATVVGEHCFLMANSHLGHNVQLGNRVILVNGVLLAGYVEVGDGAFFGGGAGIHQFVRIGRLAMLQGMSAISQDVPPFCTTHGTTLNSVAGLNIVGLRRAGLTPEQRLEIKHAFKLLYCSGLNYRAAVARIRAELPPGPAHEMADFVTASKRGIVGYGGAASGDAAE
ncbi:MAG: acyl-ACP--UDP-N-acetylglucosamine O-acyltransferase [Verrucomicrobia bacterium]|nr:MAG: acyl-ACP--UDP-N-acetylglucosamine O-acyltransferase [Verrucomicrobiota bacterium]